MQVLISDANILIDLEDGLLLERIFNLPFVFRVPDILFDEELKQYHGHLLGLGLQVGELLEETMRLALTLTQTYVQPSRNDCFALALALQEKCPLLTGDKYLAKAAQNEQVEVHGTLWLVEHMVRQQVITKQEALDAYDRMRVKGRRLPWSDAHLRIDGL